MQAALNVEGLAYCTLEIEGVSLPPSMNLLSSILIMDGFGIGVPVMQMVINDEQEYLSRNMAIRDGVKITICIGRDTKNIVERSFRVFGWRRTVSMSGPRIELVALLDAPAFAAGSFSEAYNMSSNQLMSTLAGLCGLKYDGPEFETDDVMTWINLGQTRLAFTEDIAMRGFISEQGAMARIVTMDGTLRYKNIFNVLEETATHSFVHNATPDAIEGTPVVVREARDASTSGFSTHFVNYGQNHFVHSMSGVSEEIKSMTVQMMGSGFPINDEVKSMVENISRMTYSGFDPGTAPSLDPAVHQKYEAAFYQNLRALALFSERLVVLTDTCTETETFDPVEYMLSRRVGGDIKLLEHISGKYLLGGKAILIKDGMRYAEAHYLYRPYLSVVSLSEEERKQEKKQNASAVAGGAGAITPADLATDSAKKTNIASSISTNNVKVAGAKAAVDGLTALEALAIAFPLLALMDIDVIDVSMRSAMNELRKAMNTLRSAVNGVIADLLRPALSYNGNTSALQQNVRLSSARLTAATVGGPSVIDTSGSAVKRMSANPNGTANQRTEIVLSNKSASKLRPGMAAGDVGAGGAMVADLIANGAQVPSGVSAFDPSKNAGSNFLMSGDALGINNQQVAVNPRAMADSLSQFANETDPQKFMMENGADAYRETFGESSFDEARQTLSEIASKADAVKGQFEEGEYIIDEQMTDPSLTYAGSKVGFEIGSDQITPMTQVIAEIENHGDYTVVKTASVPTTWENLYATGSKDGEALESSAFPSTVIEDLTIKTNMPTSTGTNANIWAEQGSGFVKRLDVMKGIYSRTLTFFTEEELERIDQNFEPSDEDVRMEIYMELPYTPDPNYVEMLTMLNLNVDIEHADEIVCFSLIGKRDTVNVMLGEIEKSDAVILTVKIRETK